MVAVFNSSGRILQITSTMWRSSLLFCVLLLTPLLFTPQTTSVGAINCYHCVDAIDNSECNQPEHLVDCIEMSPPGMEYDACQTRVSYTEGTGELISKRCVSGPCFLGDDQSNALGLGCDHSGSNWQCETCCNSDGCNISASPTLVANLAATLIISLILALWM